eukprot:scpid104768/ scgid6318/ 
MPGIDAPLLQTRRIGRPSPSGKSRLVHVSTNKATKATIMDGRFGLKFDDTPVYVNHDLTPNQQKDRRQAIPIYKQLRAKGIKCYLPYAKIVVDGTPISYDSAHKLLEGNTA